MNYDLKDKIILITGANRGIGKSCVDRFIAYGAAKVYAAVRRLDSARSLAQEYGRQVVPIKIDLEDPSSITNAAEVAGDVQVVVNNAGVLKTVTPLDRDAIPALEFEMKVNVYGLIRMAQAFAPILKANGGGVFVQLNSVVSMKSFARFSTYSASKAAAYSITQVLRRLLGKQGTVVLSVHPGPIATDMGDAAGLTEIAESPALVAESIIEALQNGTFHVYPDKMAQKIGGAYQSFAENIVEGNSSDD